MMTNSNNNSELEQIIEASQTALLSVKSMAKTLQRTNENVEALANRMDGYELDAEITTAQNHVIKDKIKAKVKEIMGVMNRRESAIAYQWAYRNLRKYGAGSPISTTQKRFYESVLRGIDSIGFTRQQVEDRIKELDEIEKK